MTFQELEGVRTKLGFDVAEMTKMLGMADGEATYASWESAAVPSEIAAHAQTIAIVRNINKGVFQNLINSRIK